MQFSNLNVMAKEREIVNGRKVADSGGVFGRLLKNIMNPRNPNYTFHFHVPNYIYLRSLSFCDDVASYTQKSFEVEDLARVLYTDFLVFVKRNNSLDDVYRRLMARGILPTVINTFNSIEDPGELFDDYRAFDEIPTVIAHKDALKGEFLLRDMLELYPDHGFVLENILYVLFCDFVDDYRKGTIKKPISKIAQYVI